MTEQARTSQARPPALTLGTMHFGTSVPEPTAAALLDEAYDRGVTAWDTANNYAFWAPGGTGDESETCIGRWLSAHPSRRDEIFLATKIGARPAAAGKDLADTIGLSPSAIREQVQASLSRLGTDHVDLLYAHIDDRSAPLAETIGALEDLRAAGLVRQLGASNLTAARLSEALDVGGAGRGYRVLQQRFTFLRPAPHADLAPHVLLDDDVMALCRAADVEMVGYSPLLSGAYTRADRPLPPGYDTAANRRMLGILDQAVDQTSLDRGQVVLAWMAQRNPAVRPVVGVSSTRQLHAAADAVSAVLAPDIVAALDAARMAR